MYCMYLEDVHDCMHLLRTVQAFIQNILDHYLFLG